MSTITVETACGTTRKFANRRDAEEGKRTHQSLCDECSGADIDLKIEPEQSTLAASTNGDPSNSAEGDRQVASTDEVPGPVVADDDRRPATVEPAAEMPDSVQTDPLDVIPEYMITEVDGTPTINKRGYAVIAHHFDIAVQTEAITTAGETDHEYAEFKARAWKKTESPEQGYTSHATARASEDRAGIENNLNEMAETRAMKRAVSWASGVGLLAWEEMVASLEG